MDGSIDSARRTTGALRELERTSLLCLYWCVGVVKVTLPFIATVDDVAVKVQSR